MKDYSNKILKLQFKTCQGEIFINYVFTLNRILQFKNYNFVLCCGNFQKKRLTDPLLHKKEKIVILIAH